MIPSPWCCPFTVCVNVDAGYADLSNYALTDVSCTAPVSTTSTPDPGRQDRLYWRWKHLSWRFTTCWNGEIGSRSVHRHRRILGLSERWQLYGLHDAPREWYRRSSKIWRRITNARCGNGRKPPERF